MSSLPKLSKMSLPYSTIQDVILLSGRSNHNLSLPDSTSHDVIVHVVFASPLRPQSGDGVPAHDPEDTLALILPRDVLRIIFLRTQDLQQEFPQLTLRELSTRGRHCNQ